MKKYGRIFFELVEVDTGHIAFLSDVIVDPKYQGKGIGRKLVETCIGRIKADAKICAKGAKMVTIKESTTEDIKNIQSLWADVDVMKYIGFPDGLHETEEAIKEWLDRFRTLKPKENHYSVFEDGKYCGETQYRIDEDHRSASLDIKLLKFARGRGIATQAISYAIEEAFKNGAEVVWVDPHPENAKAISLYQRLGFEVKEMPEHVIALGEDPHVYKYMERCKDIEENE